MKLLNIAADPLRILFIRMRFNSALLFGLLTVYIGFSLFLFFQWVDPSLNGSSDQHIAADSGMYIYFADSLRHGNPDPYVIASLATFPNNLWSPVLQALVLKTTFAMVVADYAMLFVAIVLLKKSFSFSTGTFVGLLLLNATTTISVLSVNKEIVDLLTVSIFLFALRKGRNGILLIALLIALFNRFELCMVMILFLLIQSKLNPLRQRRILTLVAVVIAISVVLPAFASRALTARFEEASSGTVVTWLDSLEMNYLYGVAVIPKVAENLFGELINVSKWQMSYNLSDIANSYILLFNNLATAVVFFLLIRKRAFTLRSDLVYFAMLGCVIMAVSLVIQPRYFYFAYVLLALQAAHRGVSKPVGNPSKRRPDEFEPTAREVAFG